MVARVLFPVLTCGGTRLPPTTEQPFSLPAALLIALSVSHVHEASWDFL
jgi:hypothetical protein